MRINNYLKVLDRYIGKYSDIVNDGEFINRSAIIALLDVARENQDFSEEMISEWSDEALWHYALGIFHALSIEHGYKK